MSEAALLKSAQELQRELKAAEGQLLSMAKSLQKAKRALERIAELSPKGERLNIAQQALAELNLYE